MSTEEDEFAARLQRQTLRAFGLKAWDAGLAPAPRHVRLWRAVTFAKRRGKVIDWEKYNRAEAEHRAREEAFKTELPSRAQEVADQLSGLLPDGLRFEWGPDGDEP
jgi:hypothetical protein